MGPGSAIALAVATASYVLVPSGARLSVAPDPSAPAITLRFGSSAGQPQPASRKPSAEAPAPARTAPKGEPGMVTAVLRLVHEQGEWVAVRPVPWSELGAHCSRMVPDLAEIDATLYVRKRELAKSTRRAIRRRWSDGTYVQLGVGAAAFPLGVDTPGQYLVDARGVGLTLDFEPLDLDWRYAGASRLSPQAGVNAQIVGDAPATYGPHVVRRLEAMFGVRGVGPAARDVERQGSRWKATVANHCVELRVIADAGAFLVRTSGGWSWGDGRPLEPESAHYSRLSSGAGVVLGSDSAPATDWHVTLPTSWWHGTGLRVKAGVQLVLPDGRPFGRARSDHLIEGTVREWGELICVRPKSSGHASDQLIVCARGQDAQQSSPSDGLGLGTIGSSE